VAGDVLERAEGALSQREVEVLEMASQGLTNTEIASRMHVTVHTVKFHLAAIYRKLGVANRTEAAVVYLRGGADTLRPAIEADAPS
jgi:two-component system, NarL family, response regulator YdfI